MQRNLLIYTICIEIRIEIPNQPPSQLLVHQRPTDASFGIELRLSANIRKVSAVSAPRVMVMRVAHF